jgi:hypothetical protein
LVPMSMTPSLTARSLHAERVAKWAL